MAARMPSNLKYLSDGERFCLDTLRKHDALFAEAVEKGLRWKVLKHEVRVLFPEALTIIQVVLLGVSHRGPLGRGVLRLGPHPPRGTKGC